MQVRAMNSCRIIVKFIFFQPHRQHEHIDKLCTPKTLKFSSSILKCKNVSTSDTSDISHL